MTAIAKLLTPKQLHVYARSRARLNFWHGAVRSGKTWASYYRFARFIRQEAGPGDLVMTGKTYQSLKRNILLPMQKIYGTRRFKIFPSKNEVHFGGRIIHTINASNEASKDVLQGFTVAGALGDEIALWPESFFSMLLSRMSVAGAKFFGTTNPEGPVHWLKKEYIDNPELDTAIHHFLIDDNPTLDPVFVANLKKEYKGVWYKRYIQGLWVLAEGAIYDMFGDDKIIIAPPGPAQYYIVGVDYGTANPTSFVLIGVNRFLQPMAWLEREYYYDSRAKGRQKTDIEYSQDLKEFIAPVAGLIKAIYIDPSAASFKEQLRRDGVFGVEDADNDVLNGIRTQGRMLTRGEYAVLADCKRTIDEYYSYVWDETAGEKRGEDKPIKQNDHSKDAERYALYTEFGEEHLSYEKLLGDLR